MKATIHKLNGNFLVLLKQENDPSFGLIQPNPNYIEKYGVPVYQPKKIKVKLHENKIISGEIKIVKGKSYFKFQEDLGSVESYAESILIGRSFTRISIERYNNLHRLATEQQKISYNMSNGFAINKYYVCFGKIKDGLTVNPYYLKIKDSIFKNK